MSHWLYLAIRFLPCWAIPLGFAFLQTFFVFKRKKRILAAIMSLLMAIIMIAGSVAFIVFKGHETLVPILYEVMHDK